MVSKKAVILWATIANMVLSFAYVFGFFNSELIFVGVFVVWSIISAPIGIIIVLLHFMAISYVPCFSSITGGSLESVLWGVAVILGCGTYFNAWYFFCVRSGRGFGVVDEMKDYEEPDGPMSPEAVAIAASLDSEFVKRIDAALMSHARQRERKVAMLVGLTMMDPELRIPGLPDIFYAERVKVLVEQGLLIAEGNLDYMRYSEVRLP